MLEGTWSGMEFLDEFHSIFGNLMAFSVSGGPGILGKCNYSKSLGEEISPLIDNIFNPELIILRGPTIDGNRFLFETVERVVKNLSLCPIAISL